MEFEATSEQQRPNAALVHESWGLGSRETRSVRQLNRFFDAYAAR